MQSVTGNVVTATSSITKINERVNEIASEIAAAITQQGHATSEIARTVQEASEGLSAISRNSSSVSSIARTNGASAGEMAEITKQLQQQINELSGQVDEFISNIRNG